MATGPRRPEQLRRGARPAQLAKQRRLQHVVLDHVAHHGLAGVGSAVAHAAAAAAVPHLLHKPCQVLLPLDHAAHRGGAGTSCALGRAAAAAAVPHLPSERLAFVTGRQATSLLLKARSCVAAQGQGTLLRTATRVALSCKMICWFAQSLPKARPGSTQQQGQDTV